MPAFVTGRLADLFRLAWGLLYWNARKSWFRLRRGGVPCPCQAPSDSGRAFETACDACVSWHQPANFRRVCPLLVATPAGLRCSVDTANVRPFWGRAALAYGGSFGAVYLAGALAIFVFLRSVGYPISIVHLVWPGSWQRVTEVRGWFFMERANRAFLQGRHAEGMLYLTNAHQFDPDSYRIGFALAQRLQFGQPARADEIYRQLIERHPAQAAATKQLWFRSLLARGEFETIETLATAEILAGASEAPVWMRALLFAARQTGHIEPLQRILDSPAPAVRNWDRLLETELLVRTDHRPAALARLSESWDREPAFSQFYQIAELTELGRGLEAVDLLGRYGAQLDDAARATLLLDAYATLGADSARDRLVATLLARPFNVPTARLLAAHLIRHPSPVVLHALFRQIDHERPPLSDSTLEAYLALGCAAGVARDWPKLETVSRFISGHGEGSAFTLHLVEAFFRGNTRQTRIAALLPALPMGLEVYYALLERYPGEPPPPAPKS